MLSAIKIAGQKNSWRLWNFNEKTKVLTHAILERTMKKREKSDGLSYQSSFLK